MRKGLQLIVPVLLLQFIFMNVMMAERISAQNMYEVTLKVNVNNPSLHDLFALIEDQTEFTISYSSAKFDLSQRIVIPTGAQNLGAMLDAVGRTHALVFKQVNAIIMVKREVGDI